ncbi:speriolin-like protein [Pangasianodon hypophthalmus]|uniref:speriolin-like protein n=1 Tax=Pangasianodon hypophthalmus TaxID=310915 RepID=UPI000F00C406|nr:speriolin-like protein [Pangasianodon hypophthalmus]
MDEREFNASLLLQNEKLRRQVEDLKTLQSVVKENLELRSRLDSFPSSSDADAEKSEMSAGRKPTFPWRDSLVDESSFRAGLIAPHRTSSSARPDTSSSSSRQTVKDPERLLGEIAFQLERRILSHVFYKQTRLYGFTVQNIQDKIIQVSTHPLTGQVDEAYRSEMTERHVDLMDRLGALGYNTTLHPPFTEFIINTYGILKERPDTHMAQERGYNDLDLLRCVMVEMAPSSLLKDLLVLFSCLCYLAEKDGKPIILW